MKLHANAALSLKRRRRMVGRVVEQGWSMTKAAEAAGVSDRTCSKWFARYRVRGRGGAAGSLLGARARSRNRTERATRVEVIAALRRLRMTAARSPSCLGMALSTVSAVLRPRSGWASSADSSRSSPPNRYERRRAGELLHIDVKKLGRDPARRRASHHAAGATASNADRRERRRGAPTGWEFVHVCDR